MALLLRAQRATFGYDGRAVISDVDLDVDASDFIGIVGPNGAGKTTLFRGLLGLVPPIAGSVARYDTRIGYVPQRETLDPLFPVDVEEVVSMGAYGELRGLRGLPREARELARASLARVGMLEWRRAPFSSLSGGQRQRVLIARALMVKPELLLLDEPTSGVDRAAQARIMQLLDELVAQDGIAILIVSHQLALVRKAAQSVLWVAGGKVTRGPAFDVLKPENLDRLYSSEEGLVNEPV
jgi:ABC-type Mn2+/Zn2+ transport system ATPase subunit